MAYVVFFKNNILPDFAQYLVYSFRSDRKDITTKMAPYGTFKIIFYKLFAITSSFVGINILVPKFRLSWLSYFMIAVPFSFVSLCLYTAATYPNLETKIKCLSVMGLGFQVIFISFFLYTHISTKYIHRPEAS